MSKCVLTIEIGLLAKTISSNALFMCVNSSNLQVANLSQVIEYIEGQDHSIIARI